MEKEEKIVSLGRGVFLAFFGRVSWLYRIPSPKISVRGNFRNWGPESWAKLRRKALEAGFEPEILEKLRELEQKILSRRREIPVVNLDAKRPKKLTKEHLLIAYASRSGGYIEVRGWTFVVAEELRRLGFTFQGDCWRAPFNERRLREVRELVSRAEEPHL
ncbi:MAG: hypothetical protein QW356_04920 [Candidatus Hadarchaeales archaeon]